MPPLSSYQIQAARDTWRKEQDEIERQAAEQKKLRGQVRQKRETEYKQQIDEAKKREDEEWNAKTSWTDQKGASSSTTDLPAPQEPDPLDKKARKGIQPGPGKKYVYLLEDDMCKRCQRQGKGGCCIDSVHFNWIILWRREGNEKKELPLVSCNSCTKADVDCNFGREKTSFGS